MPISPPPSSATGAAPVPACACGRLRRAARALTQLYDDAMAPSGLRITQFSLLRTVARDGKARISDLAATLLLERTALSRNLDPLLARGLLSVTPGRDARTREVALTRSGAKALQAATPCWKRAQAQVAKRLGGARLDALIATLADVEALHPARTGVASLERNPTLRGMP
ncbi:MAG: MarR family winged helix-turn-helix transcriptional regulator [Gemmatimonadaceae bacterium]